MALVKVLYLSCIFFGLVNLMLGEEGIKLHLKANRCSASNPKFIQNVTCRIRAFNRSVQLMTNIIHFRPGVKLNNYKINITSYRKFGMVYRPSLVKIKEDWCAAMSGSESFYVKIMLSSFSKYGNVIKPCPISGYYFVKDMFIDTTHFPQFAPIGDYRMDYHHYTVIDNKEEFVMLLQDFWEVKPKGAQEF